MPADYQSTARALALPVDDESPSRSGSPVWRRPRRSGSSLGGRRPQDYPPTWYGRLMYKSETMGRSTLSTFMRLSPLYRILFAVAGIASLVLGILFLAYNERIFAWLSPMAKKWKDVRGGWLVLWLATFFVSFPPMIGYSTCMTLAGFVYGLPNGWFIAASATIIGSTASFLASRAVLSGYVHRMVQNDTRFAALSLVLKHDGFKLLCMVRLCPLPYSLSNGAIATIPTVHWAKFMLATAVAAPKLFIHIFIGSRIAKIADEGGKMSGKDRAWNYFGIAIGAIIGIVTGWVIYKQTKKRAQELEAQEEHAAGSRRRSITGGRSGRSFADSAGYADDPEAGLAADTLTRGLPGGDDISLQEENEYRDLDDDASEHSDRDVFAVSDGSEHRTPAGNEDGRELK